MATNKQKLARKRNFLIWRLKGMHIPSGPFLTKREKEIVESINLLRKDLIEKFTKSSIEMGLNAKKRCLWCNNPAVENSEYCKKHNID